MRKKNKQRLAAATMATALALGLTATPAHAGHRDGVHNCFWNTPRGTLRSGFIGQWWMRPPGASAFVTGNNGSTQAWISRTNPAPTSGSWGVSWIISNQGNTPGCTIP